MYKRTKLEDPLPVKDVLTEVFKDLDLEEKMRDYKIMQLWSSFVAGATNKELAKKLDKYTFAHRISIKRDLVIGVKAAVIANELQFMKPMLETKFIELLREKDLPKINAIVFELRS